ncbi:unnamed protein product [Trichogramma brassicae]|uniref:Peptidase S1 domain-containing protein n=1 Tax=Trichogramma brassicae TaxID=86971 RepID=A0A6H5IGS0_9HYME|nr:unnamed protein product [Trichogramma brassicae]
MKVVANLSIFILCLALRDVSAELDDDVESRITFGQDASPGEFPHHISMYKDRSYLCGGALISPKHVLTAAHCVQSLVKNRKYELLVEVGTVNLGKGRAHRVSRIVYNRGFDLHPGSKLVADDIAVIHLKAPVELSDNVKPIKLPVPNSELPDQSIIHVSGFGISRPGGVGPVNQRLQKVQSLTISRLACSRWYLAYMNERIGPKVICVRDKRPGASIGLCYSGGAQSRIANLGETAQRGELPHHVDIFVNKSHHCGAALISARHVLTAAHCLYLFFDPNVDNRLEVIVGTVELGKGASYGIRRIAYPAEFDPKTVANDIAVVHLKRSVILSANVKPVSLPRNKFDEPNVYDSMIIAGYGWDKNNIDADYLKVLQTQVVSPEWCSRFFKIESTRFCTYRSRDYGVCPLSEKLQRQTCATAVTTTRQLRFLIRNDFARNRLLSNVSSSPADTYIRQSSCRWDPESQMILLTFRSKHMYITIDIAQILHIPPCSPHQSCQSIPMIFLHCSPNNCMPMLHALFSAGHLIRLCQSLQFFGTRLKLE